MILQPPCHVDRFPSTSRTFFLTHAHKDHLGDERAHITSAIGTVYSTEVTKLLVLERFPSLARRPSLQWVTLDYDEPVRVMSDDGSSFRVTALDADHCAGSCMLLFDGDFGHILHTGDARLTNDIVDDILDALDGNKLDSMLCDATFGHVEHLPSLESSIANFHETLSLLRQLDTIYVAADTLGTEPVLRSLRQPLFLPPPSAAFGFSNAGLVEERRRELNLLEPGLLTDDPATTKFVLCGGRDVPRLASKLPHGSAVIRPSAMEIILNGRTDQVMKNGRSYYVLFARHSSRAEINNAYKRLKPKHVTELFRQ